MKKIALITKVILLATVFVACKQNGPEPVVEKYYTHFYRAEFDEIRDCVMEEHRSYYDLLKQIASSSSEPLEKPKIKVTDIKCEIIGDSVANCTCLVQDGELEDKKEAVQLKKVDKKWLVNQGKEGNMFYPNEEVNETDPSYDESSVDITGEE